MTKHSYITWFLIVKRLLLFCCQQVLQQQQQIALLYCCTNVHIANKHSEAVVIDYYCTYLCKCLSHTGHYNAYYNAYYSLISIWQYILWYNIMVSHLYHHNRFNVQYVLQRSKFWSPKSSPQIMNHFVQSPHNDILNVIVDEWKVMFFICPLLFVD